MIPKIERYIIYAVALAAALFFYFKPRSGSVKDNVTVELKYDSIAHRIENSTIERPIIVKQGQINIPKSELLVLQGQDTALLRLILRDVLNKYYAVVTQRTVSEDDSLKITTVDTVSQNRILGRSLEYKIKFPVQQITNNPPLRNRVYVGGSIQTGEKMFTAANVDVYLVTKRNMMYKVDYNLLDLAKGYPYSFGGGVAFKIGRW